MLSLESSTLDYQKHTKPAAVLKKLKEWKIDDKMLLFISNFTKDRSSGEQSEILSQPK
jgi:hypothetical protein